MCFCIANWLIRHGLRCKIPHFYILVSYRHRVSPNPPQGFSLDASSSIKVASPGLAGLLNPCERICNMVKKIPNYRAEEPYSRGIYSHNLCILPSQPRPGGDFQPQSSSYQGRNLYPLDSLKASKFPEKICLSFFTSWLAWRLGFIEGAEGEEYPCVRSNIHVLL